VAGFTTEAVADASNYTDSKYMAIKGGSSTQITKIKEVSASGLEASTSAPQKLLLAFDGTVGATLTSLTTGESDTADIPATAALAAPVLSFVASTTKPQRAKAYLANLGFNAIGGLHIKRFPFGEEPQMIGNAAFSVNASGGEVSLSGFTGTTAGVIGAHIKYETLIYVLAFAMSALTWA
jgi:hypothetical protein